MSAAVGTGACRCSSWRRLPARTMSIKVLVFAIWTAIHPLAPRSGNASEIAAAIADVLSSDPRPPVFTSREEDASVMAYYALRESWLRKDVVGDGGRSFGVWQEQSSSGRGDVLTQARAWVALLREGAKACPESPAAPLSGGCKAGRRVADRRVARARALLAKVSTSLTDTAPPSTARSTATASEPSN